MKPLDILFGTRIKCCYRFGFPVILPSHSFVGQFESKALLVGYEGSEFLRAEKLPGRHNGLGPSESGVGEMSQVPVVGMLAAFLRKVRAGAFGP